MRMNQQYMKHEYKPPETNVHKPPETNVQQEDKWDMKHPAFSLRDRDNN